MELLLSNEGIKKAKAEGERAEGKFSISRAIAQAQVKQMAEWQIKNDVLCSKESANKYGCVVCKNFWQQLEKEGI